MNSQWAAATLCRGILATNKVVLSLANTFVAAQKERKFHFLLLYGPLICCYSFFTIVAATEPEQFRNFYSIRYLDESGEREMKLSAFFNDPTLKF